MRRLIAVFVVTCAAATFAAGGNAKQDKKGTDVEIDGLKGVQFREANPEKGDDFRRLQWIAFRKYLGQLQQINVMLSTDGKDFDRHKDALYGILYSTKVEH